MHVPVFLISLSCALLVLLGGLFLLAYAKKEGLGKMTKLGAYVAIVFGTVVFVCGLVCATMCGSCHKGGCDKAGACPVKMEHHMKMMDCHKPCGGDMACPMQQKCDGKMACPISQTRFQNRAPKTCCFKPKSACR